MYFDAVECNYTFKTNSEACVTSFSLSVNSSLSHLSPMLNSANELLKRPAFTSVARMNENNWAPV